MHCLLSVHKCIKIILKVLDTEYVALFCRMQDIMITLNRGNVLNIQVKG